MMGLLGEHIKPMVAERTVPVFDESKGIYRQVVAGQDIPLDLREAYAEVVGGKAKDAAPAGEPAKSRRHKAKDAAPAGEPAADSAE